MDALKLIFMGTPEFALPTLRALLQSQHRVLAVYTQPPRPAGRGNKDRMSPVHAFARTEGLPVFTPAGLRMKDEQRRFRQIGADAVIVAAYGLLLPQAILDSARLGCINVHPSLLPRWRGAAPIMRTIMAGDEETGVAIMQMNAGLDTGDILALEHFTVSDGMNAGQLHDALSQMAGPLVLGVLADAANGNLKPNQQSEEGVTYAAKITKEECRIDWRKSARVIRRQILGLSPSPGAWFSACGEAIKILDADCNGRPHGKAAGTVLDERLSIACPDGILNPLRLQRPGRKPLGIDAFASGFRLAPGTTLT